MKKLPVYLILFLCTIPLWAQDQFEYFETGIVVYPEFGMEEDAEEPEPEPEPIKEKFRLKNRTVELSIAGFNFNFANDFITAADVFRSPYYILENIRDIIDDPILLYNDPIKINLNDFFDGFKFQFGTEIKPLSINFNRSDRWGFGLDIGHIKAEGNQALAENILTLNSTDQERSGVGGAIFVDVGIPVFFHIKKLKVKIRPSVYVPLVYTEPEISYVIREGTEFKYTYNMHVYSLVDFGGLQDGDTDPMVQGLQDNYWSILRENMGYDFCLGLEYPLNRQLDIGFNAVNIPVPYAAATLNHYMQVQGSMSFELHEIDVSTIKDDEGFWEKIYKFEFGDFTTGYDEEGKKIYRPFKLLFYANYRPFGTRTLTLIPSLGFSINYFYSQPAAVEGGLGIRFDLANIIITTFGVNYNDRRWKNSIDFALNLRAFEIDLGLSFEGINFIQSWQGAGLCVNFGLKLGW